MVANAGSLAGVEEIAAEEKNRHVCMSAKALNQNAFALAGGSDQNQIESFTGEKVQRLRWVDSTDDAVASLI